MLECVDLFCGAGGLSLGLMNAGMVVRVGVDCDLRSRETYQFNFPNTVHLAARIQDVRPAQLLAHVENRNRLVLAGGPPCQLFSRLNRRTQDISEEIVAYTKLIKRIRPYCVIMENVPAIIRRQKAWSTILATLESMKYRIVFGVLRASHFGVPQNRDRLIVIAGKMPVSLPAQSAATPVSVRDAIGHFPLSDDRIPNHRTLKPAPENLRRLQQLREGESSRGRGKSFRDSYARMYWDRPAPTITTKCISFSNGRFGHPKYDRALTIREAASLQGFPETFTFFGSLWDCARQVGNAVPPPVSEAVALQVLLAHRTAEAASKREDHGDSQLSR